jgi:hypothetical protein
MRIVRNERRIRVSSTIARYAVWGGMLALVAGTVITFTRPEWVVATMVCLAVGFSLTVVGSFFSDRFVGPFAHYEALADALKYLGNRYTLLQYRLPCPHVLLGPGGCTVFVVKTQSGQVTYQESGRWKHQQKGKFWRQFAGQEAVGAPNFEAEREIRKMERWLARNVPDVETPVQAAIVFVNPQVTLDVANSPVPTLPSKKLKAWLQGPGKLDPLPDEVYRQLADALGIEADG